MVPASGGAAGAQPIGEFPVFRHRRSSYFRRLRLGLIGIYFLLVLPLFLLSIVSPGSFHATQPPFPGTTEVQSREATLVLLSMGFFLGAGPACYHADISVRGGVLKIPYAGGRHLLRGAANVPLQEVTSLQRVRRDPHLPPAIVVTLASGLRLRFDASRLRREYVDERGTDFVSWLLSLELPPPSAQLSPPVRR